MNTFNIPSDWPIVVIDDETKKPDTSIHPHGHKTPIRFHQLPEGRNYGIVLNGKYVLHDVDNLDLAPDLSNLPPTWTQRTKKGYHRVYLVPEGTDLTKYKNGKLYNEDQQIYGDLKVRGYFVGPGSTLGEHTYTVTDGREPVPYEGELEKRAVSSGEKVSPLEGVQKGSHGDFLHRAASFARGQAGLSGEALFQFLKNGPLSVLQDVNEEDPFTDDKISSIVRSVETYDPVFNLEEDVDRTACRYFDTFNLYQPLQRWLIPYFLPMDTLSLIFGKGGIGKSTLGSYGVRAAVKRDLKVAVSVMEESVELFGARVLYPEPLSRKELGQILELPSGLVFPRDVSLLEQLIEEEQIDVLYFDSIYSHFDPSIQGNEATRARMALSHLAKVAQARNVTVIGVFHENKGGEFLGSVEMRNVCRTLLHATQDTKTKQMKLKVVKSNYEVPEYALLCLAEKFVLKNFEGQPWQREGEDGKATLREAYGIHDFAKVGDEETYEIDTEEDKEKEELRERIRVAREIEPNKGERKLADAFGVSRSTIRSALGLSL